MLANSLVAKSARANPINCAIATVSSLLILAFGKNGAQTGNSNQVLPITNNRREAATSRFITFHSNGTLFDGFSNKLVNIGETHSVLDTHKNVHIKVTRHSAKWMRLRAPLSNQLHYSRRQDGQEDGDPGKTDELELFYHVDENVAANVYDQASADDNAAKIVHYMQDNQQVDACYNIYASSDGGALAEGTVSAISHGNGGVDHPDQCGG
ncbi:hypothetical protein CBOM_03609 [Ceraceosorus bombacis]|uniref:Uncharacterized protein n=1 Tax=Ceraceosorus bombacis TaxID=401625 RepID=A0A0P1BHM1_9BASI|nr:hypothetical protein CBOM_03609 [Ceraceosorus bombacis]